MIYYDIVLYHITLIILYYILRPWTAWARGGLRWASPLRRPPHLSEPGLRGEANKKGVSSNFAASDQQSGSCDGCCEVLLVLASQVSLDQREAAGPRRSAACPALPFNNKDTHACRFLQSYIMLFNNPPDSGSNPLNLDPGNPAPRVSDAYQGV